MPDLLESLLKEIEAAGSERGTAGAFRVVPIPGYPKHYFGVDEHGSPCVLLHSTDTRQGVVPALRLKGLLVQYAVPCRVTLPDGSGREAKLTTIVCLVSGPTERRYFLHAAEILLRVIGPKPDLAAVIAGTQRLADLFQRLALPARRPLTGLLGELVVIRESRLAHEAVTAWRSGIDDTYDFAAGDVRLEVKAANDRLRTHFLSYEQCHPPTGTIGILASVFIESSGGGVSLEELIREIEGRLIDHNDSMLRLHQVVTMTLGTSLTAALGERFDRELARESLQFFEFGEVPAIRGPLPTGVANVRFRADLSTATPRQPSYFRSVARRAMALLPDRPVATE